MSSSSSSSSAAAAVLRRCTKAAAAGRCWNTSSNKFTSKFPCELPIMGAPMAGPSGGMLAYETCRAGALGFIAAGHNASLDNVNNQVAIFRSMNHKTLPPAPLCIGFIGHSTFSNDESWERFETVLKTHKPDVVQFFAPSIVTRLGDNDKTNNVEIAKQSNNNCLVLAQVGNVEEGIQALEAGVDGLIAQGSEAGGHGLRPNLGCGTLSLASSLIAIRNDKFPNIPVLAAGGIVNGRTMAAAMALGCDGVVLGTRLWATNEAIGHDTFKSKLVSSTTDDSIRTTVFDQIQNSFSSTPWPHPYDTVGVIKNDTTAEWDGRPQSELAKALTDNDNIIASKYKKAVSDGDPRYAPVYAGKGVGDIHSIEPAYDIIHQINSDAMGIIDTIHTKLLESQNNYK